MFGYIFLSLGFLIFVFKKKRKVSRCVIDIKQTLVVLVVTKKLNLNKNIKLKLFKVNFKLGFASMPLSVSLKSF